MKATAAAILLTALQLTAQDVTFANVRTAVPGGKKPEEKRVELVFSNRQQVLVRLDGTAITTIPYSSIQKIDYEYAKHHRVAQGAVLMVASLGVGAIVMLTKSTNHWMAFYFRDNDQDKELLLRLDKKDYRAVIAAAEAQTGKKVEILKAPKGM